MTRLDPRARAMLRAYRHAKVQAYEPHEALWSRIEASLDHGALGPIVEPPAAMRPRWLVPTAAAAVAVAAVVIAALSLAPGRLDDAGTRHDPSAAPHGAVPAEPAALEPAPRSPVLATPKKSESPRTAPPSATSVEPPRRARPRDDVARSSASSPPAFTGSEPLVDELQLELAMIRKAREALREHHPERALELLDAHARAFPAGQMLEDRQVLRIEALCAAGKAPQARAEVALFLRAFPRSAHAQRVRESCP